MNEERRATAKNFVRQNSFLKALECQGEASHDVTGHVHRNLTRIFNLMLFSHVLTIFRPMYAVRDQLCLYCISRGPPALFKYFDVQVRRGLKGRVAMLAAF